MDFWKIKESCEKRSELKCVPRCNEDMRWHGSGLRDTTVGMSVFLSMSKGAIIGEFRELREKLRAKARAKLQWNYAVTRRWFNGDESRNDFCAISVKIKDVLYTYSPTQKVDGIETSVGHDDKFQKNYPYWKTQTASIFT